MFPNMLCGVCKPQQNGRNLKSIKMKSLEPMSHVQFTYSAPFDVDPDNIFVDDIRLKPNKIVNKNSGGMKKMATKVSHFSDLIHRVTASCFLHPSTPGNNFTDYNSEYLDGEQGYNTTHIDQYNEEEEYSEDAAAEERGGYRNKREMEMVAFMAEVFETVSSMTNAYVTLQEAHCPWDGNKIRLSDVAVVAELRRLGVLRERFRRSIGRFDGGIEDAGRIRTVSGPTLREVVAPYEAALEELRTEVKSKAVEVDYLRQKLNSATAAVNGGGRKSRSHSHSHSHSHQSKRRVSCSSQFPPSAGPFSPATTVLPELFEACMNSVTEGSRSFASMLLSLMKSAHWDITATVNSITATSTNPNPAVTDAVTNSIIRRNHAKYALESYINRKLFENFEHETFCMDGIPSSRLNPSQFRSKCFTDYSDMKSMDPTELLGLMPTCKFGKFSSSKYLTIVHPRMEESLFGDLEQRRQVLAGNHPRNRFYGEFLGVAKAVWLLHLIAFSLDPLPSHFEGSEGAEFHGEYMESVVVGRVGGGGEVVGFPVSPGFKLGNGCVVKARVYLVPRSEM